MRSGVGGMKSGEGGAVMIGVQNGLRESQKKGSAVCTGNMLMKKPEVWGGRFWVGL